MSTIFGWEGKGRYGSFGYSGCTLIEANALTTTQDHQTVTVSQMTLHLLRQCLDEN